MPTSSYIRMNNSTTSSVLSNYISLEGIASFDAGATSFGVKCAPSINPILYFKYIKSKFKMLERMRLDARLKKLEKAFYAALENGQSALADKFLLAIAVETRESALYAKGIRLFIEKEDVMKYKQRIRDGHISDTMFKDFTRVIPKNVLQKKKNAEDVFDGFVIYHYWNENAKDVKKMNPEEKAKMRDPVLFGIIKETDRLYYVDDWEDEYCDLTFAEIADVIGKDEEEMTISKNPKL